MMVRGHRKFLTAMTCVAVIALSTSGCSNVSEEQDEANIAELEERGFSNPRLARAYLNYPRYDVTIGNCRITVERTSDGWWLPGQDIISSARLDATAIQAHADEIGLDYCFG